MLPSLKGVFPKPKTQHKRDFLRENKLHLKDLQRNSSRQQLAQKVEEEEQKLAELRRRQRLRHKSLDARQFPVTQRRPSSGCSCDCGKTIQTEVSGRPESTVSRKVETCTREVQTDYILDEEFLYQALKRCSSTDIRLEGLSGKDSHTDYPLNQTQLPDPMPDNHSEPDFHFENLAIDTERLPPTASSTQISTKRTTRRVHELGDRQDVRLPKYLERQKREKEEQKQKELQRDRNCPFGYEPLTEEERIKALNIAQKKFQDLVGELNRMPMTTETLRIRGRKVEIERELVDLENDIRIFSKPKVYVKMNGVF
ncbi:uncharacterized protein LOC129918506 [Episyrphus balteatus]|uniref:uncharacterized protein LOC129918506 n=1 Tax=Episyrphus balteatus TaxID=286459 RepID=UPI002485A02E|nr:uncharacterized protein LOC129918506 [Episyrphus balteatus]